jgi:hypothetical protein
MADIVGSLIDKLLTVDLKLWNSQEMLYEIRRMTFEEYKKKYFESEDAAKVMWEMLKKTTDLNYQRSQLVNEIDEKLIEMIKAGLNGEELNKYLQKAHKTY